MMHCIALALSCLRGYKISLFLVQPAWFSETQYSHEVRMQNLFPIQVLYLINK